MSDLPETWQRPQLILRSPPDLDEAWREWKANCGPAAIAAALGLTLAEVRTAVPPSGTPRFKGFMNIRDVQATLRWLDVKVMRTWTRPSPSFLHEPHPGGPLIAMLQFGGPWNGIPRVAATFRHLIAFRHGVLGPHPAKTWVYDVNADYGWSAATSWEARIIPDLIPPRGDGTWTITWACQIEEAKP